MSHHQKGCPRRDEWEAPCYCKHPEIDESIFKLQQDAKQEIVRITGIDNPDLGKRAGGFEMTLREAIDNLPPHLKSWIQQQQTVAQVHQNRDEPYSAKETINGIKERGENAVNLVKLLKFLGAGGLK